MSLIRTLHTALYHVLISIRTILYRNLFKKFGHDSFILGRITVYSPENISIGTWSKINEGALLNARAEIKIGNHVHISPYAILNTGGLDLSVHYSKRNHVSKPIKIEDGVWIGSNAIINPGVTLGQGSVVGAGAVVTSDVPEYTVVAGVPARELKKIKH